MAGGQRHIFSSAEKALVLSELERDQLAGERKKLARRRLTRGEVLLLWSLRIYLLFMIAVVFYQIVSGQR